MLAAILATGFFAGEAPAFACGASAGGSAAASACSLEEHRAEQQPRWRFGAAYTFTSTSIRFSDDLRFDETRGAVLATADYRISKDVTLDLGVGATLGGHLGNELSRFDFSSGLLATLGTSWRAVKQQNAFPFLLLTGQAAFIATSTRENGAASSPSIGYHALDVRLGAISGWTLWKAVTPYVLARAFGGPVYWQYQGASETGTDTHHYQIGAGVTATPAPFIDLFVEGAPAGEQEISAGAGVIW